MGISDASRTHNLADLMQRLNWIGAYLRHFDRMPEHTPADTVWVGQPPGKTRMTGQTNRSNTDPLIESVQRYAHHLESNWRFGTLSIRGELICLPGEVYAMQQTIDALQVSTGRGAMFILHYQPVKVRNQHTINQSTDVASFSASWLRYSKHAPAAGLTALRREEHTVRTQNKHTEMFDLRAGSASVRMCTGSDNKDLITQPRQAQGVCLFTDHHGREIHAAIVTAQPRSVLNSPVARFEVIQNIPSPGLDTPLGPHTHVFAPQNHPSMQAFMASTNVQGMQEMLCLRTPRPNLLYGFQS